MTQAHRATDPATSAWVSANAGAGKTYLLTDRVTRLLLSGADPARILCLTYTKAAASEMATRLFNRLGEWALLPDADLAKRLGEIESGAQDSAQLRKARKLFAQALETPGGLKIQTIHAFCQNVLTRFPIEAGIPARFTVLDDRSAAEVMRRARGDVLDRAFGGDTVLADAIAFIATRASDGRFGEILDAAIGDARKLRAMVERHSDAAQFIAHMRETLGLRDGDTEDSVVNGFLDRLNTERALLARAAQWLGEGSTNDVNQSERLTAFLNAGSGAEAIEALRPVFLTGDGPRKSLATKGSVKVNPALFAHLENLRDRFIAFDDRRKAAITAALTEALVTVSLAVLDRYSALKRARATLDYDDLTEATLALLEREDQAQWVLYKLDNGLAHILIDEAQDTSPEQWRIVTKLSEEFFSGAGAREDGRVRTIFAVGDEKQSIFSFQGADPAEFGRNLAMVKARVTGAGLAFEDARPTVSRRSTKSVLEFVDAVFSDGVIREGLTSAAITIQHDPHRAELGRVEIWPCVKAPPIDRPASPTEPVDTPARNSAAAELATRIADRIAGWLDASIVLPGKDKPVKPGDIMVLVRRRGAFAEEMIRKLIERRVPVAGADRMVLLDQIAIADLVALGRFALLPEDDLTLAALLKSPLVNLSEEELFDLAHGREGRLWTALIARAGERDSFTKAHAFLSSMLSVADFVPPFEFYARALGQGLRMKLVARLGAEAADAIDEFLALALAHEGSHPPSLESFLDWFEKGASEVKRDMEQGGGAVRVMTVHGAKGLEADIVIVPDTAQIPEHGERAAILYTDDCVYYGVDKTLANAAILAARTKAHDGEMREYRRLLYVALTRAREWLIVCGYENRRGVHPQSWHPAVLAAARRICREEPDESGETNFVSGWDNPGSGAPPKPAEPAAALPEFLTRMAAPEEERPRTLRPSDAAGIDETALSPVGEGAERRFRRGLLVHALLARLPEIAPQQRDDAARNYLLRHGATEEEAAALAREALAILCHPNFAALFAEGSRAEIAVTAMLPELGNVRVNGQIDRLAVTANAVLIADFKTNRPPPKSAEATPVLYRAQMALYRAALQKIYPAKRIDCALVWTEGPSLMVLPPELLDAEIGRIAAQSTNSML